MKKKGLIIATIVMVLVLAVSLTTATYAWFSASGSANVNAITLSVTASADVLIGVEKNNEYDETANPNNFYSENTTWEYPLSTQTTVWEGDSNSLGLNVQHNVTMENLNKAIYSFSTRSGEGTNEDPYKYTGMTTYTKGSGTTVTTGIDMSANYIVKANGSGETIDTDSTAEAVKNRDYLDIAFGTAAGTANVKGYGCLVYILPSGEASQAIGMNAAIHVKYRKNGGAWTEVDAFGDNRYNTTKTSVGTPTMPKLTMTSGDDNGKSFTYGGVTPALGSAIVWIPLNENFDGTYCTQNEMTQLELVIYVCGPDNDCITSAMGVSATISINFLAVNSSQAADVTP